MIEKEGRCVLSGKKWRAMVSFRSIASRSALFPSSPCPGSLTSADCAAYLLLPYGSRLVQPMGGSTRNQKEGPCGRVFSPASSQPHCSLAGWCSCRTTAPASALCPQSCLSGESGSSAFLCSCRPGWQWFPLFPVWVLHQLLRIPPNPVYTSMSRTTKLLHLKPLNVHVFAARTPIVIKINMYCAVIMCQAWVLNVTFFMILFHFMEGKTETQGVGVTCLWKSTFLHWQK